MFEFDDLSAGFHDLFMSKCAEGPIMDLYISDSMQDMLDIDIKSEVATVVGGANEFSSLMNNDLPSLEISGDSNSNDCDTESWAGATKWPGVHHDIYADVGACVNPNSVMPVISSSSSASGASASVESLLKSPKNHLDVKTNLNLAAETSQLPSPRERKSHLTFSPSTIKIPMVQDKKPSALARTTNSAHVDQIKKDLHDDFKDVKTINKPVKKTVSTINNGHMSPSLVRGANTIKLAGGIGGLTFANSNMRFQKLSQQMVNTNKHNGMINGGAGMQIKRERSSSPLPQFSHVIGDSPVTMKNGGNLNLTNNNNRNFVQRQSKPPVSQMGSTKSKQDPIPNEFPKPAYSYSCLIALALKNSRSGSLPVSEIYSFMCEHFPYFKTAPNGWKNSVRHNLSLNKCFEKIEKPATNGGQRKGCLWAMNPSKIVKMDDEVQKWSRKDPMAIRKAMVHPEHLESLERGEMKHGSTGDSDGEEADEDEVEDVVSDAELDNEVDESFITPPESCEDEPDIDLDVEVSEFYDDLSMDTKEGILESFSSKGFLSDVSLTNMLDEPMISSTKRARLDVNYSITTTPTNAQNQFAAGINQNRRKAPLMNRMV